MRIVRPLEAVTSVAGAARPSRSLAPQQLRDALALASMRFLQATRGSEKILVSAYYGVGGHRYVTVFA